MAEEKKSFESAEDVAMEASRKEKADLKDKVSKLDVSKAKTLDDVKDIIQEILQLLTK